MIHQTWAAGELHPKLTGDATLTAYARPRNGTLADKGGDRWAVLLLPGGGYSMVADGEGEPVALAFLAAGIQTFVLRYSVAPTGWPQQFLEAAAALAFLRAHSGDYGVAPDHIAVCGFSAGGHLAGCLANLWGDPLLDARLGLTPEAAHPDAAILCYPVISTCHDTTGGTLAQRLMNGAPIPEQLSLERSVTSANPPTFLWSTWTDATVPIRNTLLYADALLSANVPCELHIYGKGPHAMGLATGECVYDSRWTDGHAASWHPLCVNWLKGL